MTRGHSSRQEEIKKYLFHELTQDEKEKFEERLFGDDDYFYDVMDFENDLVDKYALKKLEGDELERFEQSLRFSPERREKIASAIALQRRVAGGENAQPAREKSDFIKTAKSPFGERLSKFLSLRTAPLRYAAAALVVLLTAGFLLLLIDRLRVGRELTRLREGQGEVESQRLERDLRAQLEAARAREVELRRQVESESGKSEALNEQLGREISEREKVERELERLRRERNDRRIPTPRTSPGQSPPQTVASVFLLPGGRGSGDGEAKVIGRSVRRVSINLELEQGVEPDGRLSVEINKQVVATGLEPRDLPSGRKAVTFSISPQILADGLNRIVAKNADGLSVGDYELKIQKR